MTPHTLLELKTGRDAEHTPETAVQLFSTLPKLYDNLLYRLIGRKERLSFEIYVRNQTIRFLVFLPTRLTEYMRGTILASYPEVMISELLTDPLTDFFDDQGKLTSPEKVKTGRLRLQNAEYLPLKTYLDFKEVDPLASLLAFLSKSQLGDLVHIQYALSDDGEWWKQRGWRQISGKSSDDASANYHRQKSLIQEKLDNKALRVSIKIAVASDTKERSELMLETLAATYNSISKSEGNSLILRRHYIMPEYFLRQMMVRLINNSRSFQISPGARISWANRRKTCRL